MSWIWRSTNYNAKNLFIPHKNQHYEYQYCKQPSSILYDIYKHTSRRIYHVDRHLFVSRMRLSSRTADAAAVPCDNAAACCRGMYPVSYSLATSLFWFTGNGKLGCFRIFAFLELSVENLILLNHRDFERNYFRYIDVDGNNNVNCHLLINMRMLMWP